MLESVEIGWIFLYSSLLDLLKHLTKTSIEFFTALTCRNVNSVFQFKFNKKAESGFNKL